MKIAPDSIHVPMNVRDSMRALGATHTAINKDAPVLVYYVVCRNGVWHDLAYSFGENQYRQQILETPRAWPPSIVQYYTLEPIT